MTLGRESDGASLVNVEAGLPVSLTWTAVHKDMATFWPNFRILTRSCNHIISNFSLTKIIPLFDSQVGLAKKVEKPSRKLRKERKNRSKKVRGTAKKGAGDPAKKK